MQMSFGLNVAYIWLFHFPCDGHLAYTGQIHVCGVMAICAYASMWHLHVMYMNCAAKCHMGAINTPFSLSRWIPGDKSTYMSVVCHVASMCCATWEAKWTARHRRLRIWNCLYWQKKACCKQNKMSCLLIFVHCFKIYCSVVATKGSLFVGTEAFLDQRLSWQPPFLLCSFSFLFRD